MLTIIYLP
jgi:hypothetical protein